jgi:hypothetical protein
MFNTQLNSTRSLQGEWHAARTRRRGTGRALRLETLLESMLAVDAVRDGMSKSARNREALQRAIAQGNSRRFAMALHDYFSRNVQIGSARPMIVDAEIGPK